MTLSIEKYNHIIQKQQAQIDQLVSKLASAERKATTLQNQIEQLLRRLYGRKSEKIDPRQLRFDSLILESWRLNGDPEPPPPKPDPPPKKGESDPRRKRRTFGRISIPDNFERVEIVLDIPEDQKVDPKTGAALKHIGDEISEKIDFVPSKLIVNVYRRPKYAAPDSLSDSGPGVITAPMPDHPIPRCKADIGLLSHIIVSKFADHLPLYRQNGIFGREGVDIPRATQSSWLTQIYHAISPLENVFKMAVRENGIIFTDDTPIPLQVKGNGKTRKARLWVYVRGGPGPPLVSFDFSKDRSKKRPLDYLEGYQGYVHADAYSGYDELFRTPGVIEVGCWAHSRRKFDEAVSSRPDEATRVLALIALLYHEVETPAREMSPEDRYDYRRKHAPVILDSIFEYLEALRRITIPSEPLRKAVEYSLNLKDSLQRYLEDGWLMADNNTAENFLRPVACGRKNYLFVGSERAGRAAALYYSLVQSCKACKINPWEYFDDLLKRIMNHPVNRLRELLPDQWKPLPKDEHGPILQP
jgi:transposase